MIAQHFGGDEAAYRAALEQHTLARVSSTTSSPISSAIKRPRPRSRSPILECRSVSGRGSRFVLRCAARSAFATSFRTGSSSTGRSPLPFLEIPWASVSISADAPLLRRGQSTVLSGTVVSARASEQVVVYASVGRGAYVKVGTTGVGADGSWSFTVTPSSFTTYKAVTKSAASRPVAVRVRRPPRGK